MVVSLSFIINLFSLFFAKAETATIDFKPVIPLPDLVDVKTGEEDETPVFHERAKIFRYDNDKKEWKEKGVGEFKILKHNINGM